MSDNKHPPDSNRIDTLERRLSETVSLMKKLTDSVWRLRRDVNELATMPAKHDRQAYEQEITDAQK